MAHVADYLMFALYKSPVGLSLAIVELFRHPPV
jgi:hypothetical protein